jgi:hypothetical protein
VLDHLSPLGLGVSVAVLALLGLAWFFPWLGDGLFSAAERLGTGLAQRRTVSILVVAIAAILLRLSLLWLVPIPAPRTHDDFSYLLAADTFAHGRLTNPPHPLPIYFETFHVNIQPTYMSKYPPGQGAALAIGELLGHPWIGVLLSVAGMCAAALWMLQGWFSARWALVGGILVMLRFAAFNYWVDSYWGGAVAAIGGALVMGALPRIFRWQRPRDGVLLGLGVSILVNSRPFEGSVFCVPVAAALAALLFSRRNPTWRITHSRVVVPILVMVILTVAFMGYYNWRGTGNVLLFPYVVNDRMYSNTPHFIWQKLRPPLHYPNPQFERFYGGWERSFWVNRHYIGFSRLAERTGWELMKFTYFFLWPALAAPFVTLPWMMRDRRTRLLLAQFVICFVGLVLVIWSEPHYAAPVVATLFALVMQGMRHLRRWEWRGRPVGIGVTRAVVLVTVGMLFVQAAQAIHDPDEPPLGTPPSAVGSPEVTARADIAAQLEAMPGKHLVIMRYSPHHDPGQEWVYNRADIDHAKIVWAREIPGVDMQPLLDYFRGRQVRLVESDAAEPQLTEYPVASTPSKLQAPGR